MTCPLCNDTGEQRYWEGRWRDEVKENERLRADNELLQTDRNRWREMWGQADVGIERLRAALEEIADLCRDDAR